TSCGIPVVITLHLWPDRYPPEQFEPRRAGVHIVCVSEAQRAACPAVVAPVVIPNGVDLQFFAVGRGHTRTVLLLGRIAPEKGFHLAIDAAAQADLDVVIAGAVFPYPSHQEYFRWCIAPRLSERVR